MLCALLLAGCAPQEVPPVEEEVPPEEEAPVQVEKALPFAIPYYPADSLDPITGGNRTNLAAASLIYEPLFQVDNTFTASPLLAQSCTTEDGLSYVLTLKSGVTFSDGSPLTAAEVVYSLESARTSARYAARLAGITAVSAGEDGTVLITLSQANGNLSLLLDIPILSPQEDGPSLGTGPYVLTERASGAVLSPRSGWWQEASLPLEEILLYPITETDQLISGFASGEITLLSTDLTGSSTLGYSGSYDIWDYPTSVLLYLGFNAASGPCKDSGLRNALSYAFDRSYIVSTLLSRHAREAVLPFSPASPFYNQALAARLSDGSSPELLSEAGCTLEEDGLLYSGRSPLSLSLVVNTGNSFKVSIARYLSQCLEELGITVELRELDWEDYLAALEKGDFDLYLGEVRLDAGFDLSPLLSSDGAMNYGGYADEETDGLLSAYLAAGESGRGAALRSLWRRLAQEAPIVPLCFKDHSVLTRWGVLEGLDPTQHNLFYQLDRWTVN